jgi:hypothetical protein
LGRNEFTFSSNIISVKDFDLSQLEFCTILQKFNAPNISSFGDIAAFSGKPMTIISISDIGGTKRLQVH